MSRRSDKTAKRVYFFGAGKAEGRGDQKDLLGGKGANLHDMTRAGLPVPPGFTITAETCDHYHKAGSKLPSGLMDEVRANLARLEEVTGKTFGDANNPLLVSRALRRRGFDAGYDGHRPQSRLERRRHRGIGPVSGDPRFARDSYRRLIGMFGDVVMGISRVQFEHELNAVKAARGAALDTDLSATDLKEVLARYKRVCWEHAGHEWSQDPMMQLEQAVEAVFKSWNTPRALRYRQIHEILRSAGHRRQYPGNGLRQHGE